MNYNNNNYIIIVIQYKKVLNTVIHFSPRVKEKEPVNWKKNRKGKKK